MDRGIIGNIVGSNNNLGNISADIMTAPVSNFSYDYDSLVQPCRIQFIDSSTNTPTSWLWNFGDGETDTVQNPEHYYTKYGTFLVTLKATNADGSNTSWQQLTIIRAESAIQIFIGKYPVSQYLLANSLNIKRELETRGECSFTMHASVASGWRPRWGDDISIYDWNTMSNRDGFELSFNGTNSSIKSDFTYFFQYGGSALTGTGTNMGFVYMQFYRGRTNADETLFQCGDRPEVRLNSNGTISAVYAGATGMTVGGNQTKQVAISVGWHEFCLIWRSDFYYWYVDGNLQELISGCSFSTPTASYIYIGSYNGTSKFFQGRVCEWSIFNYDNDFSYTNLWRRGDIPMLRRDYDSTFVSNTYLTDYKYSSDFTTLSGAFDDADHYFFGTSQRGYVFTNISKVTAEKRFPEKMFGGTIWEVDEYDNELQTDNWYNCKCVGYEELLDRVVVDNDYYQRYSEDLLNELMVTWMTYENILKATNLTDATNVFIPTSKFKMMTMAQCLDELAKQTGRMWWVDPYRMLHFVPVGYYTGKVNIKPGSPVSNVKVTRTKEDYINEVWAEGQPIDVVQQSWVDDTRTIKIGRDMIPASRIVDISGGANPGTSGYYQSEGDRDITGDFRAILRTYLNDVNVHEYICVEEGNIDNYNEHPDWEIEWRKDTPLFEIRSTTLLPNDSQYIAVHCSYRQRIFKLAENHNEQTKRADAEVFSSGVYQKVVKVDYSSATDIQKAADIEMNTFIPEQGKEILSFDTYVAAIYPGQVISCYLPQHNINGTYLIYSVDISDEDKTLIRKSVSAIKGSLQTNWVNYWKKVVTQKKSYGSGAGVGGGGSSGGGTGGDSTPNPTNPTVFSDTATATDSLVVTHNP